MPDGTTFFGETLKGFLKAWNTEYHHPIATKREVALWGSFLGGSKYFWNATKMSIRRDLEDPLIYEAELIGDTNRISTLLQGSFRFFDPLDTTKEERELTDYGFKIKDKVSVFAKNRFFFFPVENMIPPPNITCDMREPFDDCIKKNGETFGVYSINPEAVKLFSLAPSVHTMKQMVNTAFPTIQHFTAEVNEPAKAWSRKPKD